MLRLSPGKMHNEESHSENYLNTFYLNLLAQNVAEDGFGGDTETETENRRKRGERT